MDRNYESMMIVQPDISDKDQEDIFEKIKKRIEELGGKVLGAKMWERERNFYYFLKSRGAEKKKYYKGCYWYVMFTLDTEKLSELKETIRLEERILRHLIINRQKEAQASFVGAAQQ